MAFYRERSSQKVLAKGRQHWVYVHSVILLLTIVPNASGQGRILAVRPSRPVSIAEAHSAKAPSITLPPAGDTSLTPQVRVTGLRPVPSELEKRSTELPDIAKAASIRVTGFRASVPQGSSPNAETGMRTPVEQIPMSISSAAEVTPSEYREPKPHFPLKHVRIVASSPSLAEAAGTKLPQAEEPPQSPQDQNTTADLTLGLDDGVGEAPTDTTIEPQELPTFDAIPSTFGYQLDALKRQNVALVDAIQSSITNKRVIHSLGAQVTVEATTQLDPLIAAQQITIAQSRFDPTLSSLVGSNKYNLPPSSFTQDGIPVATKRDEIDFITRLSKEWATGATTSVGYEPSVAYLFFPAGNPNGFNPNNEAGIVFQGVQPILRGAGRRNNLATIRIAENREDQVRLNVESKLQTQLVTIEKLYWELHAANVRRAALVEAIALSQRMLEIEKFRYQAKRVIYADVARVGVKLENLIQQKLDSEQKIQKLSLQLAQISGFAFEPTSMLVPQDSPEFRIQPFQLESEVSIAMQRNPDLLLRRHEIEILANQLQVARNQLRPQLDFRSSLRSGGLNEDLGVALADMSRFEFIDLSFGLVYSRQMGNRNATAKYRQTELETSRSTELLAAVEQSVAFNLAEAINSVQLSFAAFESALRQLSEAKEWVNLSKIRYENPPEELGQEGLLVALVDYQSALQARVDAVAATASALAIYNTNLASVDQQKGTLLDRWGINIACNTQEAE